MLRTGRAAIRRAVTRRGTPQPVPFFGGLAGLADPVVVVPELRACSVLAGQRPDEVDVVPGVPDRDPADRLVVLAVRREPGAVHDVPGQVPPLSVRQPPVLRRGPDHAVPHRPVQAPWAEGGVRLGEQSGDPPEVPAPVRAHRWLQFGRVPPPGNEVRIPVLLTPTRPVQVPDQACGLLTPEHLPDHRSRLRTASAAASSRSARRTLSAAYGSKSPGRCPVAFSFATAWFRLTPDPPHEPSRPDQLGQRLPDRCIRWVYPPPCRR